MLNPRRTVLILIAVVLSLFGSNLRAQPELRPSDLTNRQLSLDGDASSTGWNPAVLGMYSGMDMVGGVRYDTLSQFKSLSYGLFAKYWYLGAGITGSTESSGNQRYYAGLGFPLSFIKTLPVWFGASVGWADGTRVFGDGELMLGATAAPFGDLQLGIVLQDLLANSGDARFGINTLFSPFAWSALRGNLYFNSADTFGGLSSLTPELGLDLNLFEQTVALSGTYDFNRKGLRLGIELLLGRDYVIGAFNDFATADTFGFRQGFAVARYRPQESRGSSYDGEIVDYSGTASPRRGWAPDRSYTPAGLSYKYSVSDAAYDPLALMRHCDYTPSGFDTPEELFETVRTGGGSYRRITEKLREVAPNPADIYKNIRKNYYSQRVRSTELMSNDSLSILSRQGYSIGIQNVDNAKFPIVSIYMQVTDDDGRSVRGLTTNDFSFVDPSLSIVSVRPIDSTRRIPVDVTLIIDCSGSMGEEINAVRANAQSFVDKMEASGADYRIGGVLYGSIIYDTLHPTADFKKFREFVSNASAIGGDEISSLAIQAATEMNYRPDAQRIFVLITDDWVLQQNSQLTEADLVDMLWNTKARLYTIGDPCKNNNAVTTRLTLGQEYNIQSPFNALLDEIGTDITTTYELVYESKLQELPKVTILRGRVRDETGRPAGVQIALGESLNASVLQVPSNPTTGEYEVEIVEGKKYGAEINAPPYLSLSESIDLTRVQKGDTVVHDFTLKLPLTTLRGQILDEKNQGVAGKVQIEDAETLELVTVLNTDPSGRYQTAITEGRKYRLTPVVPNYIPTPAELDTRGVMKGTQLEKNLHVISIDEAIATGATFRLNNIFFDFDKADLKSESIPELNKLVSLLNEYPVIKVEVGAHTDARGSDDYNQRLSERRAQSVVNWLIEQGISASRLVSRGYGETKPVADNETDDGRALNRRVEFKLLK